MKIKKIHDHHLHFFGEASLFNAVKLWGIEDKNVFLEQLKNSSEEIILGYGWKDHSIHFTSKELENFPPLVLFNASFHGCLLNSSGKKYLSEKFNFNHDILDASIGSKNNSKLSANVRQQCLTFTKKKGEQCFKNLNTAGIFGFDDMGFGMITQEVVEFIIENKKNNKFNFFLNSKLLETALENKNSYDSEIISCINGIKVFMDGALGTRSALINEKYDNKTKGTAYSSEKELSYYLTLAAKLDKEIAIHAIGNVAIDKILTVIESIREICKKIPKIRIEHAQFISRKSAKLAKKFNITLSMQPNFSIDTITYQDRLPIEFLKENNPFRMLIDDVGFIPGKDLLFGSDGMPYGLDNALKASLNPPLEEQKLTIEECEKGYS
jgi:predicted amidohydrolase YtcJ